jgi:indole-3-glycerol phosphate synthase
MILDDIVARTRLDLVERKAHTPLERLEAAVRDLPPVRSLWEALRRPGQPARLTAIAEFKRRSPSAGWIRQDAAIDAVIPAYVAAGAAGLSVLTDGPFFGGSLADLTRARALLGDGSADRASPPDRRQAAAPGGRPAVLRKDFVVDAYQLAEARAAGADAVLLIVAALDDRALRGLFSACATFGLEALVETHDRQEAARAVDLGATIVGVNHRDLRTFTMDMDLAVRLRAEIPPGCVMVAESGIRRPADARRMAEAGIDAILVGESLMRATDPGAELRALIERPGGGAV